jgi:hypothetical protein
MKKVALVTILAIALFSCNDESKSNANASPTDSTVRHPDGVTNGSVISTDTAAMNSSKAASKDSVH